MGIKDTDCQIVSALREPDVLDRNTGAELDIVTLVVFPTDERVMPIAPAEQNGVLPVSRIEDIIARSALECILAIPAQQGVVAQTADQRVLAISAAQEIVAVA